jgi:hypothetical protein
MVNGEPTYYVGEIGKFEATVTNGTPPFRVWATSPDADRIEVDLMADGQVIEDPDGGVGATWRAYAVPGEPRKVEFRKTFRSDNGPGDNPIFFSAEDADEYDGTSQVARVE